MKFILIFGPQAVGKMTVGHELEKLTELKLLHNHATIDLLEPLFGFTEEMWQLSSLFRNEIFKAYAESDKYGLIFTFLWALNDPEDWKNVKNVCRIFEERGAEIYFVELEADVEERLKRNITPHRLEHKPTKRNVVQSEQHLLKSLETMRFNSLEGEIKQEHYIKINNQQLSPAETAQRIKDKFGL